jgi:hypothetical protein
MGMRPVIPIANKLQDNQEESKAKKVKKGLETID